jgi:hypothetical protein
MTVVAMMTTIMTMRRARMEAHLEALLLQIVHLEVLRLRAKAMNREIQKQQRR